MIESRTKYLTDQLFILLIGSLLFFPFLGGVHLFDWDEINFAEAAREMIVTGDYLTVRIHFRPFWEKPPLFIWMQVLSMKIFGINEFAARFPNAVCGIVTLIALYRIGRSYKNRQFALLWPLVYVASVLSHFYFKSGIIDPWFNFFIFAGIYYAYRYFRHHNKKLLNSALAGFFIGLAILTKGPVALLVSFLTILIFMIRERQHIQLKIKEILIFFISLCLTGGLWFIIQIVNGNFQVVMDFILYQIRLFQTQDAGHGGFPGYHIIVLFFGVFPASVFALPGITQFRKIFGRNSVADYLSTFMFILFWVVLVIFTIVRTKIVHYSSLCYFPITFFAAVTLAKLFSGEASLRPWRRNLIIFVSLLYTIIIIGIQFFVRYKNDIIQTGIIKDDFAVGNLQAQVNWTGIESIGGALLIITTLIFIFGFKRNLKMKYISLLTGTIVFIQLTIYLIVGKVERYTQHAAIEFYKTLQNKDCYVEPLGFKSYAHYFYARTEPPGDKRAYNEGWLLTGDIDKPAFFVCKIHKAKKYSRQYPKVEKMYGKNGFVFFKRNE